MKTLLYILLLFNSLTLAAQRKFTKGIYVQPNYSVLAKKTTIETQNTREKFNFGGGFKFSYEITASVIVFAQTGVQQSGLVFKSYIDAYNPRYRLTYSNATIGAGLKTITIKDKFPLFLDVCISENWLLKATRKYDNGKEDIIDGVFNKDTGLFFAIRGTEFYFLRNGVVNLQLYSVLGFSEIFRGTLKINGLQGKLFSQGLQINFVF